MTGINLNNNFRIILISLLVLLTSGCASIVNGVHQPMSVETGSIKNATCKLQNNKGTWYIPSTPGTVVVNRSFNDMHISCEKNNYRSALVNVSSSTKPMAFGNIIFGGVIGAGVDVADGAAYDYPSTVHVAMQRA